MKELHPYQQHLINCIQLEMNEQEKRFNLDSNAGLKQLKVEGVLLHPIQVTRKSFGYADYPEVEFRLPYVSDTTSFKVNSAIECFVEGETPVKGVFLGMDGKKGSVRLFAPEFPDWIEEKGVGIKLAPDHHTSELMKKGVKDLSENQDVFRLFQTIHGNGSIDQVEKAKCHVEFENKGLNESQKQAVCGIVENSELLIVHGPPGTGKTTTLVEAVVQQVKLGKRLLIAAPSNAATDNIARELLNRNVELLRVGNSLKVDDQVFKHTSEGRMQGSKMEKDIKRLKIRAEEFRKMAMQYKRKFGKEEREQRSALFREVKKIRREIKDLRDYFDEKLFDKADVIVGTPIGLCNFLNDDHVFDTLVIDEAGQALEPLAWLLFPKAKSWVLAGDPFQLPPTVLSEEATQKGFNISILEHAFQKCKNVFFLDTQYRMRKSIAGFSSDYFYNSELQTPESLSDVEQHIVFFDTAGTGYEEQSGNDGVSLMNEGELSLVENLLEIEGLNSEECVFISPYSGQVQIAKESLPESMRISTIDSFQGQESKTVIVSLVRSNEDATIGFLKDYRRMNVALTRAKEKLVVIGDSSTIGQDKFYGAFLEYMENVGGYRSAWELMT